MTRAALMLAALLGACGGGSGVVEAPTQLRLRLETSDPHLPDVAVVEVELRRGNVTTRERIAPLREGPLRLPHEVVVPVRIGPGPLEIDAVARGLGNELVGSGEAEAEAAAGATTTVVVALFSERADRPTRRRAGSFDGGATPADDAARATDAARVPDSAGPDSAVPDSAVPDAAIPDDAAQDAPVSDRPADAGAEASVSCATRVHLLSAGAVISLDYGMPPRDPRDSRVVASTGLSHGHGHDYVGWMRFDLSAVSERATLMGVRVFLTQTDRGGGPPPLGFMYSATDSWAATLDSDRAESIVRTARIADGAGAPRSGRAAYAVDVARYRPFFTMDLADNVATLGLVSTTPVTAPETWSYFAGVDGEDTPELELTTCE